MEHHHLHILHIYIQHHLYNQHHHHHLLIHIQQYPYNQLLHIHHHLYNQLLYIHYHLYNDHHDLFPTVKVIPELKIFLEELDAIYREGKYTQYLEIFEKHDIRVNLISKISDEWWENKLQITSLGHILTLKEAASKYT